MRGAIAWMILLGGCLRPQPAPVPTEPAAAHSCAGPAATGPSRGDRREARAFHLRGAMPEGRLTVSRLPAPAGEPVTRWEDLSQVRLRVVAENVSMSSLLIAVGEAVPTTVVLDRRLLPQRVSLVAPDVGFEELVRILRQTYHAVATFRDQALHVVWAPQPTPFAGPLESRFYPLSEGQSAQQVADALCHHAASSRGRVSVVGGGVLVTDVAGSQRRAERLLLELASQGTRPEEASRGDRHDAAGASPGGAPRL